MSSGRKIFRFLKFMEDLKKLYSYIYKTPDAVQVLKAMLCLSSFFYHIMDNLVWAANTGIIDEFLLGEIKWKLSKNFFSYIRNWIKITMDCIKLRKYISYDRYNEEEILNKFNKEMSKFKVQSDYNIIAHALKNRAKIRMKSINIMHSALRIYMLSYNLKIDPLYRLTHPIFIGFLGVIHASISIYKNLSKSDFTNTYSIYGFSERNVSSLEKLLIDEKSDYYYILEEDYFDNYYIDFNKDFQILLINIDSI